MQKIATNYKRPRWLEGLRKQGRVVSALMMRDILSRYGHENFGFFWIIGEPLLLTCGVMSVWSIMGLSHGSEIGIIPFALTGYTFITLWRHIVSRSVKVMGRSINLKYHHQIDFIDIIIANGLVELVGTFTAFLVAEIPLSLLGFSPMIRDPLILISGFVLTAWFSFAFGLVLASISELNEGFHHLVGPLMYLTLPLTGTFFMVDWLPEKAQRVVIWSPLVNGIEMVRAGLFPSDNPTHYSVLYLSCCSAALTAVGCSIYYYASKRVHDG